MLVGGRGMVVGASIGIADGDFGRAAPVDILAAADAAMYAAKRSGTGRVSVSNVSLGVQVR
jgi:PleD family two-component response regulator